ncbi:MAG: SurA N-terminal domain-containing protein [Syntrophales bacterium]
MENLECPHCGSPLGKGVAACGECGKEITDQVSSSPQAQEERPSGNKIYAILAVFLVVVGGAALLMFTGLLPNPIKGGSTAAIVNGEKISTADLDQKLELFKKMSGQGGKMDFSSPEGKKALAGMRMQILDSMIQEKILTTEAIKEKITVSPQEIADRIASIKKGMNLSDKDFEGFLKSHNMGVAAFEKRLEKDILINKLLAKGMQEKGLTKDAWLQSLNSQAKVEILVK